MKIENKTIRLFVPGKLANEAKIEISAEQKHYLLNVMRVLNKHNSHISVFNEKYGEFSATIDYKNTKTKGNSDIMLLLGERLRSSNSEVKSFDNENKNNIEKKNDIKINLIFTAIKQDNLHFMLQKSTEIGVHNCYYCAAEFSNFREFSFNKLRKLQSILIEAAEQCGRLGPPRLFLPQRMQPKLVNSGSPRRAKVVTTVSDVGKQSNGASDNLSFIDCFSQDNFESIDFSCTLTEVLPYILLQNEENLDLDCDYNDETTETGRALNLFCHPYIEIAVSTSEKEEKNNISLQKARNNSDFNGSMLQKHDYNISYLKKIMQYTKFKFINIFIGPEGGFSSSEQALFMRYYNSDANLALNLGGDLMSQSQTPRAEEGNFYYLHPLSLNREGLILRAETAAIVAINMVQNLLSLSGA